LQAGFEGETAVSVLRRLIGPYGLLKDIFTKKASVYDLLKPLTRPEISVHFRDFFSKVNQSITGNIFFNYEIRNVAQTRQQYR
jgi:hypothetical protein